MKKGTSVASATPKRKSLVMGSWPQFLTAKLPFL